MSDFYNPYNFVPLKRGSKKVNNTARRDIRFSTKTENKSEPSSDTHSDASELTSLSFAEAAQQDKDIAFGNTHIRHDAWLKLSPDAQEKLYSGKIIVSLTTKSPTVVGNIHRALEKNTLPSRVFSYTFKGQNALPGSSLRGMISSVAEMLSQSNMRVLKNQAYSARANIKESTETLSALGRIEKITKDGEEKFYIRPLKLPTVQPDSVTGDFDLGAKWKAAFQGSTWRNALGFYILGFDKHSHKAIRQGFLKSKNPDSYKYSDNSEEIQFYAVTHNCSYTGQDVSKALARKHKLINGGFLLAQAVVSDKGDMSKSPPVYTIRELAKGESPNQNEIKGIIYALDRKDGATDVPRNKTKQWFIPYDEKEVNLRQPLAIAPSALDAWQAISEQRFNESKRDYPIFPKGIDKTIDEKLRPLQHGDIVYFDVDEAVGAELPMVTRLSYSGVWRLPIGGTHQYFDGFLPFGAAHSSDFLSPAEQLFGVVEQESSLKKTETTPEVDNSKVQKRCLASRIKIGDGISVTPVEEYLAEDGEDIILKILSGPKAPSPAMYFKDTGTHTDRVSKGQMSKYHQQQAHNKCLPNGWKRYLPRAGNVEEHQWRDLSKREDSEGIHLQMQVNPIAAENTFYFPVDFENLTKSELELLLFSLCPEAAFKHRLGLGKPFGLGMVEVQVERLLFIDRCCRYSATVLDENNSDAVPRYNAVYSKESKEHEHKSDKNLEALKTLFPLEYIEGVVEKPLSEWYNADSIASANSLIDVDSFNVLCKLGNENALEEGVEVCYPKTDDQLTGYEKTADEGYKWFVNNDKASQGQALPGVSPIRKDKLPTLKPN